MELLKSFLALIFVISLIGITYFLLKKYMMRNIVAIQNSKFKIEEILYIDQKRKMISIKRDRKTYLLLLSNTDQLIDVIHHE